MSRCKGKVLFLQLGEEANVLDRDDGLVGKGLEQGDLGIGKGAHLSAQDGETAKRLTLAQERDFRSAVDGIELEQLERVGILTLRHQLDVVEDDRLTIQNRASPGETASEGKRQAHQPLHLSASVRGVVEALAL